MRATSKRRAAMHARSATMVFGTMFYHRTLSTSLPLRRVSDRHPDTHSGAVIREIIEQVICSLAD